MFAKIQLLSEIKVIIKQLKYVHNNNNTVCASLESLYGARTHTHTNTHIQTHSYRVHAHKRAFIHTVHMHNSTYVYNY